MGIELMGELMTGGLAIMDCYSRPAIRPSGHPAILPARPNVLNRFGDEGSNRDGGGCA